MLLQGSHRVGKVLEFELVLENALNLKKKTAFVLEFCKITLENMNKSFKNIKITTSPFRFMGCAETV